MTVAPYMHLPVHARRKQQILDYFNIVVFCCALSADVATLANKVSMSLHAVNESRDQLAVIDRLEHSYVSAAMRQLVC